MSLNRPDDAPAEQPRGPPGDRPGERRRSRRRPTRRSGPSWGATPTTCCPAPSRRSRRSTAGLAGRDGRPGPHRRRRLGIHARPAGGAVQAAGARGGHAQGRHRPVPRRVQVGRRGRGVPPAPRHGPFAPPGERTSSRTSSACSAIARRTSILKEPVPPSEQARRVAALMARLVAPDRHGRGRAGGVVGRPGRPAAGPPLRHGPRAGRPRFAWGSPATRSTSAAAPSTPRTVAGIAWASAVPPSRSSRPTPGRPRPGSRSSRSDRPRGHGRPAPRGDAPHDPESIHTPDPPRAPAAGTLHPAR